MASSRRFKAWASIKDKVIYKEIFLSNTRDQLTHITLATMKQKYENLE